MTHRMGICRICFSTHHSAGQATPTHMSIVFPVFFSVSYCQSIYRVACLTDRWVLSGFHFSHFSKQQSATLSSEFHVYLKLMLTQWRHDKQAAPAVIFNLNQCHWPLGNLCVGVALVKQLFKLSNCLMCVRVCVFEPCMHFKAKNESNSIRFVFEFKYCLHFCAMKTKII